MEDSRPSDAILKKAEEDGKQIALDAGAKAKDEMAERAEEVGKKTALQSARQTFGDLTLKDLAEHEKAVKAGEDSRPPRKTVSDDLIRLVKKEIPLRTDAS